MNAKQEWNAFNATFDRILSAIIPEKPSDDLIDTYNWIKRMLLYNVPHGKRNRGMAVIESFRLIAERQKRVPSEEELELARVLGWNVEFMQAYFLVVDDMMDQSITRRGQPCWYKLDDVGLFSCNDAIIIDQENFHIIKLFFSGKPYYTQVMELMHDIMRKTAYGQFMDTASNPPKRGPQFHLFTQNRYINIIKYKTSYYSFVLPVRLSMYLASMISPDEHKIAEEILVKIGILFQAQDDFLDCWGDPERIGKIGRDIEEGKCCWPVVTAMSLANDKQIQIIKENYAKNDVNCVGKVKDVYNELKLKEVFLKEEEIQYKEICKMIDNLETRSQLNPKIFRQYLDKIYRREK